MAKDVLLMYFGVGMDGFEGIFLKLCQTYLDFQFSLYILCIKMAEKHFHQLYSEGTLGITRKEITEIYKFSNGKEMTQQ